MNSNLITSRPGSDTTLRLNIYKHRFIHFTGQVFVLDSFATAQIIFFYSSREPSIVQYIITVNNQTVMKSIKT